VRRSVAAVWWRRNRCAWIGGSGGDVVHSRPDSRRARAEERGWTAAGCGETRRRIGRRQRRRRHPAACINTRTHTRAYRRRTPFNIGLLLHDRYQRGLVHVHVCDPKTVFFGFFESIIDPLMRTVYGSGCYDAIRYTGCYFNLRSKADTSRLTLPHGNRQLKSGKQKK